MRNGVEISLKKAKTKRRKYSISRRTPEEDQNLPQKSAETKPEQNIFQSKFHFSGS